MPSHLEKMVLEEILIGHIVSKSNFLSETDQIGRLLWRAHAFGGSHISCTVESSSAILWVGI